MNSSRDRSAPYVWAIAYAAIASIAVTAASTFEGTLYIEKALRIGGKLAVQHPYVNNFSTILDFAILNPVAIYFLLRARRGFAFAYAHFGTRRQLSRADQLGSIAVSLAVGCSAMWFYFKGFVGGTFFTESFAPLSNGMASITLTGWLIFTSTALFISLVTFVGLKFGNYVIFIGQLENDRFQFRLPPSISKDIEIAIAPCLSAAYVLATLFVILVIFALRDFLQFEIRQSWRVWLFAPYLVVCAFTFLPFWRLHNVMIEQRKEMIEANNNALERQISTRDADSTTKKPSIDPAKLMISIDRIGKMQAFYRSIPTWPASSSALLIPNISVLISTASLAYKLFDSLRVVVK